MNNDIYLIGEVGWEVTLNSVIELVSKADKEKPLNVHIHSPGGSVYDGLAIYNYLKNLDQEIHTSSSGLVASIASIIFLAGKKETRTVNKTDSFLIHLPMGWGDGNAKDLEKSAEELRAIEGQLADIYEAETDLTKEEALEIMEKDEFLDVDFLKEKGFVSEIVEFKAVANLNSRKMAKKPEEKEAKGILERLDNLLNKHFGKQEPVNKIMQDATGEVEIDFTELDAETMPSVDDVAQIDGQPASGEYLMPSGETYVFTDGVLTEIQPASDEEDMEALKARITELEDKLSTANATIADRDEAINSYKVKLEDAEKDFKDFKATLKTDFDYEGKTPKKEPKAKKKEGRSLWKDDE